MYFQVKVKVKFEDENSRKVKSKLESYLVEAESVTEAECRIVQDFKDYGNDYEVVEVKKSGIVAVIYPSEKR